MRRVVRWVSIGVASVVGVTMLLAVLGVAVMLLWNNLVPELFHGPQLGYWQALGLLVLCRVLFGGLRGHGHWRQRRWRERWQQMTPEERARLRERFVARCGHGGESAQATPGP